MVVLAVAGPTFMSYSMAPDRTFVGTALPKSTGATRSAESLETAELPEAVAGAFLADADPPPQTCAARE